MTPVGNTIRLPITNGEVLIDATVEGIRLVCRYAWHVDADGYAAALVEGKRALLHRLLLGIHGTAKIADHRNLDRLDNRRQNLRVATKSQNGYNRGRRRDNKSGYKGVYRCSTTGHWRAEISAERKRHKLGRFADPISAAKAYDAAALRLHGEFARTNFQQKEKTQ